MKKSLLGLVLLSTLLWACQKEAVENLKHDAFDDLLVQYVNNEGKVDYVGFKTKEQALKDYLDLLKSNAPGADWSANKEMAYWINMYNAFTIYNILLEHPVASIMDIDGGQIWTKRTIEVGNNAYTLDQIEQERLLSKFKEPRVHFAVNCAAASCPPLLNKAWTEENIEDYYEQQAKAFINNPTYNTIAQDTVQISAIFNWYASDFGGSGQIVTYLQQYANTNINNNAVVQYKNYDWALNKQ